MHYILYCICARHDHQFITLVMYVHRVRALPKTSAISHMLTCTAEAVLPQVWYHAITSQMYRLYCPSQL